LEEIVAAITLKTRMPVNKLRKKDFDAFPIWEYADDEEGDVGMDETWVRPVNSTTVPRRSYCHVAADFSTPEGKKFFGFVTVSTLEGIPEVYQGVILYNRKYLFVPNPESFGYKDSRRELLNGLGLSERKAFPMTFTLRTQVAGHLKYTGGTLP
jgi:hypothetical protein